MAFLYKDYLEMKSRDCGMIKTISKDLEDKLSKNDLSWDELSMEELHEIFEDTLFDNPEEEEEEEEEEEDESLR